MPPPSITNKGYEHTQGVEWPNDLLGPNYWRPDSNLISGLPKELKGRVGSVTESGIRFYQKVKHKPAPMISGDKTDPDAIHALQFALDRQDELEHAIRPPKEHPTEPLMLWLQERKKSHVKSMQAVVVAEEGEMYDVANKAPWEIKLAKVTNEHVEHLRFIFRTVMARIDIVPPDNSYEEKVQPKYREAIIQPFGRVKTGVFFPKAQDFSFWRIDSSMMESSTVKVRQAALTLYHQGRVMSAGMNNIPVIEQKPTPPVFDVVIRAMTLTIHSIDVVWVERQDTLPKEEEERIFAWLLRRKDAAVDLRFALIEFHLPLELYQRTVKLDNTGMISVLKKGEYFEWGKLFLI